MTFSIRAIFALTVFVALLAAILFVFSNLAAAICSIVLNPMISTAMIALAIYGRGTIRAFGIGASAPTVFLTAFSTWLVVISGIDSTPGDLDAYLTHVAEYSAHLKFNTLLTVVLAVIGGSTAIAVRWFLRPTC